MEVRNNPVKDENDTITNYINAPVAQLDRVLVSETKGHRFESCRARQFKKPPKGWFFNLLVLALIKR